MSILVKLVIDDKKYRVVDFSYNMFQKSDYTGKPSVASNSKSVTFLIESDKGSNFFDWSVHPAMRKQQIKIEVTPVQGASKGSSIELLDVYCLQYEFSFFRTEDNQILQKVELSPATIAGDGFAMLKKYWSLSG